MSLLRADRSRSLYPVAKVLDGSEVIRIVWGFTKGHAFRRARHCVARQQKKES